MSCHQLPRTNTPLFRGCFHTWASQPLKGASWLKLGGLEAERALPALLLPLLLSGEAQHLTTNSSGRAWEISGLVILFVL